MFCDLMNKSNAEYELAFRLFDLQRRGKVSLLDFKQVRYLFWLPSPLMARRSIHLRRIPI
jgi:hypothetical protein